MFVNSPHLPDHRVIRAAVSGENKAIIASLKMNLIEPVLISRSCDLSIPVSSHADMLIHHLGNELIIAAEPNSIYVKELKSLGFIAIDSHFLLSPKYPNDIRLNCLRIGKKLFGMIDFVDPAIKSFCDKNNVKMIKCKQGYTKCSVCIVNEHAVITADPHLAALCREEGIDVLRIREGYIELPGYLYGFIGGCSGLIDNNLIAFTGEINNHPDYNKIVSFLSAQNTNYICLTKGNLIDIGGIIPLLVTEEKR